jgi:hemoglobin/transferrin/lactoferrin receptor protein
MVFNWSKWGALIAIAFLEIYNNSYAQYQLEKIIHEDQNESNENSSDKTNPSKKIIDEENLKKQIPTSVDDLLQTSTEATTTRGPRVSGEGIQIRGFDAEKIYILIDGVRQNYREGHSTMSPVDIENLKAVKIQKNATDFSRSGSLGGGIEFVTKDPLDYLREGKNWGSEFQYKNFSANNEQSINAKAITKKNNHSALLSITRTTADNLKLNNGSTLDNSSFEDLNGLFKYIYKNTYFSYEKYYREDDNPLDPSLNPPNTEPSLQSDSIYHKDTFSLGYKKEKLKTLAYINTHNTKRVEREARLTQNRQVQTLGTHLKHQFQNMDYGFDLYQDKLSSNLSGANITDYPNAKSINASSFIERPYKFNNYTFTPGLQLAYYRMSAQKDSFKNKEGSRLSKKLQLQNQITDYLSIYVIYSEAFNAPEVLEVYPEGLHSPGDGFILRDNYFIPNENLKHESSAIKEFGLNFEDSVFNNYDLLKFKASIYQNDVKDYIRILRIDRSVLDPEDGTSQFVNIPKVTLLGSEAELSYFYNNWEFSSAYSKIRGKNKTDDLFLEDLPADQIRYQLKYFWEEYKINFGYLGIQAFRQNRTNPQTIQRTEKTGAYYVHNAFVDKEFGDNWLLSLRGNNLGNKNYRRHAAFLNEASEDFRVMLKFKWNTL